MRGFAYPMALFLLPAVRGSKNERDTEVSLIALSRVPAAVSARRPGLLSRGAAVCVVKPRWLGCGRGGPEEAGQLACDRDGRDVVVLAARAHAGVEVM